MEILPHSIGKLEQILVEVPRLFYVQIVSFVRHSP